MKGKYFTWISIAALKSWSIAFTSRSVTLIKRCNRVNILSQRSPRHTLSIKASEDDNSLLFFASYPDDESEATVRARDIPYQYYLLTHDERSCTVTAQQYASQMMELQKMKDVPPLDVSIPYEAAAEFYYDQSDKKMSFEEFKTSYIEKCIQEVKAKREQVHLQDSEPVPTSSEKRSMELGIDLPNDSDVSNDSQSFKLPFGDEISDLILRPESDLIDIGLVMLSSLFVAILTLPIESFSENMYSFLLDTSEVLNYFFCFGFFLRWYAVGQLSPMYFTKILVLIDVFASVLPVLFTTIVLELGRPHIPLVEISSSALVNLRLLRLFRIQQSLVDMENFRSIGTALGIDPEAVRPYQLKLARVVITIFTLLSVSTGLIYTAEHEVNEAIPDYFTALYFGLTTLTTVGFGDITPITLQGKFIVMGSILFGVAVIPAQGAELFEALIEYQTEKRQQKMIKNRLRSKGLGSGFESDSMIDPRIACANCGKRSHRQDAFYCWNCGSKLWE